MIHGENASSKSLRIGEVAKILSLSVGDVLFEIETGRLKARYRGGACPVYFVRQSAIDHWRRARNSQNLAYATPIRSSSSESVSLVDSI